MKTNKQTIEIRRSIVLFFMSITFCIMQSCSTEEALIQNEATIKTVSREQTIQFLQQNPLRTSSNKATKTINLPNYDAISQEKISNSDQFLTVIPLLNNDKMYHSRILLLTINDTLKSVIFNMYSNNNVGKEHFNCEILITDLNGVFLNGYRVTNGNVISQFIKGNFKSPSSLNKSFSDNCEIHTDDDPHCICNIQYLNEIIIPPKSGGITYLTLADIYGDHGGGSSSTCEVNCNSWSYGGGGGYTGADPVEEEVDFEDKIDDSKLDPCPKGVMDQLKNTTNNDVAAILNKLGANSVYNVNMEMGAITRYAQTQKISKNNYLITVSNDSYTNSTQLFRAAVMIHEIIHAYYHSVIDDNNSPTTSPLNNYSALYQAYEQKKYPGGVTVAQHDQMAKDYIDSMAMALQEYYYNSNPLTYPLPSYEIFTDLA